MKKALFLLPLLILFATIERGAAQDFDPSELTGLYGLDSIDPALLGGLSTRQVTRAYIPDAIDLSPLMPPPLQQIHGSCVSYAIGYALRGYYAALESGSAPGHVNHTPSPAFLHSRIRNRADRCENSGSHPFHALKYFVNASVPDRQTVPEQAMCTGAAEQAQPMAGRFRINRFDALYEVLLYKRRATSRHLDAIKQQLAAGHPVTAGFELYAAGSTASGQSGSGLQYLQSGEIYQGSLAPHGPSVGNHQMVFIGYDERRQAFLVQNSWGPFWAGDGRGWISYQVARQDMRNAYVMRTRFQPPRPVPGMGRTGRESDVAVPGDTCSKVYVKGTAAGGVPLLAGFVSSPAALAALTEKLDARITSEIDIRPWPVCEVLKTLDPLLAAPSRPEIRMLGGNTRLRYGDSLAFRVTAPGYASFLYIVYLQADGTVVNLLPRRGPLREQARAGEAFLYGDGRQGRRKFTVSPPAGTEAIVVIAARSPLRQLEDLEDLNGGQFQLPAGAQGAGGDADDRVFLTALRAGMAEQPDRQSLPRDMSAAVLHVTIEE